ncbi:hypothetical protein ACHAXT_001082 [Thalassiosira profunda]
MLGQVEGALPTPHHLPPAFAYLPPFLVNTYEFLQHFVLFFLVPIAATSFCAIVAAALAKWIYRVLFAPYATPEELMDYALKQLKKNEGKTGTDRAPSARRKKALDTLRLVIQLNERSNNPASGQPRPEKLKPYILLATELFYGEMNAENQSRRNARGNSLRRRGIQRPSQQQRTANAIPTPLVECQETITKGLRLDPKNEPLLKLQSELQLYARDGSNANMMSVGCIGWMNG